MREVENGGQYLLFGERARQTAGGFDEDAELPENFLAALEAFCNQAARVVRLDAETRALRKSAEETGLTRARSVEELEAFHREALGALRDAAKDSAQPLVHDYVRQVIDLASRIAEDARRAAFATNDRELAQSRVECDKRRNEVRDALEKLFAAVRLPVAEAEVTMTLVDGRNDMSGSFTYEGGIFASFTLGAGEVGDCSAPRHVRELAQDVTLPVGVRRSLFKRTVAPETIALDEFVLGGFVLKDDRAELRQRAFVGLGRKLARQKVVARVALGDVDDVALPSQRLYVGAQDQLHGRYSETNGRNAIRRARLTAMVSIRWCLAQLPEIRRGTIFPRSETNFLSRATSR